jgi:hypothetical protein
VFSVRHLVDATPEFYVADYAGVLTSATKKNIIDSNGNRDNGLEALCDGAQIVVVTIKYLDDGMKSDEYAKQLFSDWGVGSGSANNGMLLLLVTEEKKGWLEIGSGIRSYWPEDKIESYLNDYFWDDVDAERYDAAMNNILEPLFSWYAEHYGVYRTSAAPETTPEVAPEAVAAPGSDSASGTVHMVADNFESGSGEPSGSAEELQNDEKIVLTSQYPSWPNEASQKYYVIFAEGYRNDRLELTVFDMIEDGTSNHIVWNQNLKLNDHSKFISGSVSQYFASDGAWVKILDGYPVISDYATEVYSSNLDVRDSNGNLVIDGSKAARQPQNIVYLETLTPVNSDRYTGNEGDSFIDTIGRRNGNVDVQGNSYIYGLTGWVARWNFTDETSWVWNEYDLGRQYSTLQGKIVLIKSHNETNFDTKLEIMGDDRILYSIDLTSNNLPTAELKIDVSNVSRLTIKLHDNRSVSGGTAFGLTNFRLTR